MPKQHLVDRGSWLPIPHRDTEAAEAEERAKGWIQRSPSPFFSSDLRTLSVLCEKQLTSTNPDGAVDGDANAVVLHLRVGQDDDIAPAHAVQGLVRG